MAELDRLIRFDSIETIQGFIDRIQVYAEEKFDALVFKIPETEKYQIQTENDGYYVLETVFQSNRAKIIVTEVVMHEGEYRILERAAKVTFKAQRNEWQFSLMQITNPNEFILGFYKLVTEE